MGFGRVEKIRTEKQGGFGRPEIVSLTQQSGFELCFYENFRTEKQRFLGGLCFYEKFRTETGWIFWGIVLL